MIGRVQSCEPGPALARLSAAMVFLSAASEQILCRGGERLSARARTMAFIRLSESFALPPRRTRACPPSPRRLRGRTAAFDQTRLACHRPGGTQPRESDVQMTPRRSRRPSRSPAPTRRTGTVRPVHAFAAVSRATSTASSMAGAAQPAGRFVSGCAPSPAKRTQSAPMHVVSRPRWPANHSGLRPSSRLRQATAGARLA
jgi:hypothetical protein